MYQCDHESQLRYNPVRIAQKNSHQHYILPTAPLVLFNASVAFALFVVYLDGGYAIDQKQYP